MNKTWQYLCDYFLLSKPLMDNFSEKLQLFKRLLLLNPLQLTLDEKVQGNVLRRI